MSASSLVHVAAGVALPTDGTLYPIDSKAGLRYVLERAGAAMRSEDSAVKLDLLPAALFDTESGEPLAEGHRIYRVLDTSGHAPPRCYFLEVIEPHSDDRGWPASPVHLVRACADVGADPSAALIASSESRQVYDILKLRDLMCERASSSRAELAIEAAANGQPADVVKAITDGWPDGKEGVVEGDGLEILPPGGLIWCHGRVEVGE